MNKNRAYLPYGIATMLIWSLAFLFTQYAGEYFSWQAAAFWRYFFASVSLLGMMAIKKSKLPRAKDLPKFLIAGLFGFGLFGIVYNLASRTMTNAACGVSGQLNPVMTAVLAAVFLKERIRKKGWLAIGICFTGALVIFLWHGIFALSVGFVYLLLGTLFLSIYNLLQRMYVKEYPAFESTAFSIIGGTLFLSIFLPKALAEAPSAPPIAWFCLIMLGFGCSALGYVLWGKALSLAEHTGDVTNLLFVQPFITSIVGFFGRGEIPGPELLVGAVFVFSGLFLFERWK